MANLLDVVRVNPPSQIDALPTPLLSSWTARTADQDHGNWLKERIPSRAYDDNSAREWATKLVSEVDAAVDEMCWRTFLAENQLPVPMSKRAPKLLTKLMGTPRAELGDILDVTMKLGFVILPFAYIDPKAWKSEDTAMRAAIQEFGGLAGRAEVTDFYGKVTQTATPARMDVYVVCPPIYYSLNQHIKAEDPNKDIFAGQNEQAFMALGLTLPTLRAMHAQIATMEANHKALQDGYDRLRSAVEANTRNTEALRHQVQNLETNVIAQLSRMQEMIDNEIKHTVAQAVQAAAGLGAEGESILKMLGDKPSLKDSREVLAALASIKFRIEEPMMFALKLGTSLRDRSAAAIIGPCWGPDFAEIIAAASGLAIDKKRRKAAEAMLTVWQPTSR